MKNIVEKKKENNIMDSSKKEKLKFNLGQNLRDIYTSITRKSLDKTLFDGKFFKEEQTEDDIQKKLIA